MSANETPLATDSTRGRWLKALQETVSAEFEPVYRRRQRRYAVVGEVRVSGKLEGEPFRRTWPLIEASSDGLTAKGSEEIRLGVEFDVVVQISDDPITARGRTVHCTQTLGGYKIGILLEFPD
jgi:hypothetical protein